MIQVKIDQSAAVYEVTEKDDRLFVNNQVVEWDIVRLADQRFHILYQNKSFNAEFIHADAVKKEFILKINGRVYHLEVKDQYDILLEKLGMKDALLQKVNDLKAPMPGLILEVKAKEGERVKKGEPLLILEAMKMENVLKAPEDVTIKSVKVSQADNVEKNQLLLVFE
ncbi:biotin/lipoyl-containing protein [Rapidithrix thailandica]|uniref:Biotin/lipoyl-containing protein n=1 Tax=Rapidithrix thailandica TaxID=413964 RepID=A0AAW9S1R8_9BACT